MFRSITPVIIFFCVLSLLSLSLSAQTNHTISGIVRDAATLETLIGASIDIVGEEKLGARTNDYGFYSLSVAPGEYDIRVSYVGYQETLQHIIVDKDIALNITLHSGQILSEVEVTSRPKEEQLRNPVMGVNKFNMKDVETIPVIFGEKDLLKTIQLLPGVLSGGEGSAGFYVRGGSSDQNLIILDEATVYNPAHLFGFFSTFNSDAIKDVNLYKGGMPAQYGGRLSSVVDVKMLDGNKNDFQVKGGLGLIASRLSIEGPIKKEKGSFMISGRRTYADLFLKASKDSSVNNSSLYFYDLNLKSNYQFSDRDIIYLSGYLGKDVLGYSGTFGFDWGNATATLRWNHVYGPRFFSNTSLIYSNFNYNVEVYDEKANFTIASLIKNFNLKQDFQFFINPENTLDFGISALKQKIIPASLNAPESSQISSLPIESRHGADLSIYASHTWKASPKLNLQYGLRLNSFLSLGPGTFSTYDADGDIMESEMLSAGGLAEWYINIEPRFSASYMMDAKNSLKVSFNRNTQSLHQLSNTTSTLPTDVWVMSSPNIKPQVANQGALGYYLNFNRDRYEFSAEVYYKRMYHQIDLKNGGEIQANPNIEADLIYGKGRAYGLEVYLKKNVGVFNGWLSYTLSKTERQFDQINKGSWFLAPQDRTHNINLIGMYQISKRLSFSGSFVFSTGNAVTFPSGKYYIGDRPIWYYVERNGYRMPNYHRLDIGLTLDSKSQKRLRSSWTFGVYNAYNHKNAYIIDFRESKKNPEQTEAYQVALFGIVPSITWNFKF